MIRGGIADKLGNGYEAKWVLKQALFVLQGRADEIRTEPTGEDAGGFEFRITTGIHSDWHQCKSRTSKGSWTVNALEQEGVLSAFARKLVDPTTSCVFVSSDPVKSLDGIVSKAKLFSSDAEFRAGLNKDDEKDTLLLRGIWKVDSHTEYEWLRRCSFETVSDQSLDKDLASFCSLLFSTDPGTCIDRLKGLFERSLTQTLTTDKLRREVVALGIGWRAQLDPSIEALLENATQQYIDTLRPPFAGIRILTPSTSETIDIMRNNPAKFIVIAGQAGCGKSATISELIDVAKHEDVPVLAFRIDRFLGLNSIGDLGEALLSRKENPVGVLGNRYPFRKTLLVIDQVDAISEATGRSPRARDLLFELVQSTKFYPEMKVVLACRTYDLENDARLTRLVRENLAHAVHITQLDWEVSVIPLLTSMRLHNRIYSERERKILCLPLNLSLYCEIAELHSGFKGEISASNLFDALLSLRTREFREAGLSWTPSIALGVVAKSMSDSQELTASVSTLDAFPGAIDALSSAGLISCVGTKIQFAHESFFDHVFSNHFLTLNISIADLLRSSEQGLFRRTQVRQILFRLRDQGGSRRYIQYLAEVMNSQDIRYLVKDAVGMWLSTVEAPDRKELAVVVPWFNCGHPLKTISQTVFNGPNWLTLLVSSRLINRWLVDGVEGNKSFALWLLRRSALTNSSLVADEIRKWLGGDPELVLEVINWFNNLHPDGSIGELEGLYYDLIDVCPVSYFDGENFPTNFELGPWAHKNCAMAVRVLGKWLQRWFELFPLGHPFGFLMRNSNNYWLKVMAEKAPMEFFEALLPLFSEAIKRYQKNLIPGQNRYELRRLFEIDNNEHSQSSVQSCMRLALLVVAVSNPENVALLLDRLPADTEIQLYFHLQAIAANGEFFGLRLPQLLDNPLLLLCGPDGVEWLPFANAAKAAMPYLSEKNRRDIEYIALHYKPEMERAVEELGYIKNKNAALDSGSRSYIVQLLLRSGCAQRGLLRTIGSENLSEDANKVLGEVDRKFALESLPEALSSKGGYVQSPVALTALERMRPKQWLSAMRKYADDQNHRYLKDAVIGGCRQLAQSLEVVVKSNPVPYIDLLRDIPLDINVAYPEAIISGLGEADLTSNQASDVMNISLRWPIGTFNRSLCWFVRRHSTVAGRAEILDLVLHVAANGSASDSIVQSHGGRAQELRVRDFIGRGGDLDMSGLNSDRGAAYLALANVIWGSDEHLEIIASFVTKQIECEPLVSVKMQMMHLLNAISKYDPDRGVELLLKLAEGDLEALNTRVGLNMLRWSVFNHSGRVSKLVYRMCGADNLGVSALGLFLLSDMALGDEEEEIAFKAMWPINIFSRQVAAFGSASNVGLGSIGEKASRWLIELFYDTEKSVRSETAHIHWSELLDEVIPDLVFVKAYLESPAFEENPDSLMAAISERIDIFPELAIYSVQKVIRLVGKSLSAGEPFRFGPIHELGQMLTNLYRAVEGQPERERQMLDVFDDFIAHDLYGTRDAISQYERD
jgi:hypothetical protein